MPSESAIVRETQALWHSNEQAMLLGCSVCPKSNGVCGGLRIAAPVFSCRNFCQCRPTDACNRVCPQREREFVRYVQEVGGFDLRDVPGVTDAPEIPGLPEFVPLIYGAARRSEALRATAVAVPLAALFSRRTGALKFADRDDLARAFLIERGAKLVVSGVDFDSALERYWGTARGASLVEQLAGLGIDLITAPNFSLFADVPREDNLHNMKRIAICWQELAAAGLPSALHLNARTDHDWQRWADFIGARPEVRAVAFEFGTGAKMPRRGEWYRDQLCRLRERVGRELLLVVRGDKFLAELRRAYGRVMLIDTDVYVKSIYNQTLELTADGSRRWRSGFSLTGEPIDRIMQGNLDVLLSTARAA